METTFATDESRWDAVLNRLQCADGRFFVAVRTTRIYCRPHCPSRTPRRENVQFFAAPRDAEAAGFRACKRCLPAGESPHVALRAAVERACMRLRGADDNRISLADLAAAEGFSPFHFQRKFTQIVGMSPSRYAAAVRAERFRTSLGRESTVARAAVEAGYPSTTPAYAAARDALGMTPASYRKGAPGETITYGIGRVTSGLALVAATTRGVCAIALGDDEAALERDLAARFPRAVLLRDHTRTRAALAAVEHLIAKPQDSFAFPLDVAGTPFQRRVWDALRAVPAGETTTYARLAEAAGNPSAVRAAASACGANPTALAIPCHRAIRRDGGLGGYRWGVERKRALLEAERGGGRNAK